MSLEHNAARQDGAGTTATGERMLDDYLTRPELADELGVGVRTLARYDALREGPPKMMLAGRILYHRDKAREWLRSRLTKQAAG